MKFQMLTLLAIILVSCTSLPTPIVTSTTTHVPRKTQIPTTFYTAVFASTPTDTVSPPTIQPTATTGIEELVSASPEPIIHNASLVGINEAGEEINSSIGDLGIFSRFYISQEKIVALHFYILQHSSYVNEFTPAPTTIPTSQWRILIYRYRTNGVYSNQPAIEADLSTDVSMEELQTKFGDCRAFTFQIVDEQKTLLWQGYFSMNNDSIFMKIDPGKAMTEGAIIGYPYSLNENEAAFFHEGRSIIVHEPLSGFYRLFYIYNIRLATPGLEANLSELTIRLFPYRDDSNYSVHDSPPIMEKSISGVGVLTIELPIDFLRESINDNNMYYLQIVDSQGNIIKDENFVFAPYTP